MCRVNAYVGLMIYFCIQLISQRNTRMSKIVFKYLNRLMIKVQYLVVGYYAKAFEI